MVDRTRMMQTMTPTQTATALTTGIDKNGTHNHKEGETMTMATVDHKDHEDNCHQEWDNRDNDQNDQKTGWHQDQGMTGMRRTRTRAMETVRTMRMTMAGMTGTMTGQGWRGWPEQGANNKEHRWQDHSHNNEDNNNNRNDALPTPKQLFMGWIMGGVVITTGTNQEQGWGMMMMNQ
jgi:hypothetical protein